jgi:ATP-binding cassette subfamily B multidrug efflux pump
MLEKIAIYRRLLGYLKPYWKQAAVAYSSMLAATLLNLLVPQIIKHAIDQGLSGQVYAVLFSAAGLVLAVAFVRMLVEFGQRFFGNWLSHRVAYDLRNQFYNAVQHLPFSFHNRAQTGDLMSRATSDITETERFTGTGLADLISTILLLIGVVGAMLLQSAQVAIWGLLPLPVLIYAAIHFGNKVEPMFQRVQEQLGVLSTTMQESLTGIRVVKAFAREPHELQKFDRENDEWLHRRSSVIRTWGNHWPFFNYLIAISLFLLLWFGGPHVLAGEITVGTLFAMIAYTLMLNGPVQRLGFLVNEAATSGASARRVFQIIDHPNEIEEKPDAIPLARARGEVTFENVSFGYQPDIRILRHVNFHIEPGQTIALFGPTGSGKSTITSLIPRFYDPQEGRILLDGIDVRDLRVGELRRQVGIVFQEPFLFSATIAENIAYGVPDAPMELIVDAAKAAHAHDFIEAFTDGYQTRVGERGVTLSGGQKQRIAIARALLYDPRILILDDSTSSVDTETEHLIRAALSHLMQGRTTFIIAQRLLTLKNADLILVLANGHIVERGRHEELLRSDGLYRRIYDLQLKDQEETAAMSMHQN